MKPKLPQLLTFASMLGDFSGGVFKKIFTIYPYKDLFDVSSTVTTLKKEFITVQGGQLAFPFNKFP